MNKYLKLALEKKLKDNNIEFGEKFKLKNYSDEYFYNGEQIIRSDFSHIKFDCGYDWMYFLESNFIKIPQYEEISFKEAIRKMIVTKENVYVKSGCFYNVVFYRKNNITHECVFRSKSDGLFFRDYNLYEASEEKFYKKVN